MHRQRRQKPVQHGMHSTSLDVIALLETWQAVLNLEILCLLARSLAFQDTSILPEFAALSSFRTCSLHFNLSYAPHSSAVVCASIDISITWKRRGAELLIPSAECSPPLSHWRISKKLW